MRAVSLSLFLIAAISLSSCMKSSSGSMTQQTQGNETLEQTQDVVFPHSHFTQFDISSTPIAADSFSTNAHIQHIDEELVFSALPDYGILSGQTAIVGSENCMFYPESDFITAGGTASLKNESNMHGTPIPFASIVQITGNAVRNAKDSYSDGMFEFQDNVNWFYPVQWQGKAGYVFGADLYGLKNSLNENRIVAELYRTGGKFNNFYPVAGHTHIGKTVADAIAADRLAFQQVSISNHNEPDEMIRQYLKLPEHVPQFITTDLIAHAQHLIFDRMLQHTEEFIFMPRMLALTQEFIRALKANGDGDSNTRRQAVMYFQVAEALLRTAPERIEDEASYFAEVTYVSRDEAAILADYHQEVIDDYHKVMNALSGTGFDSTLPLAIFKTAEEDFSQYKVRGHYTKNGALSAYFRAQMWYGRIHFLIARIQAQSTSTEMEKTALFIIDTVKKNVKLYNDWSALFNPITKLMGFSDDLSIDDVLPLWEKQLVTNFSEWSKDENNLIKFMMLCHEKLKPPAISGNSAWYSQSAEEAKQPPMGWRLFGQRFTIDSAIHHQLSAPRLRSIDTATCQIYGRELVTGLDIMKALGSRTADVLLEDEYIIYKKVQFHDAINKIEQNVNAYSDDYWNATYYTQVLRQIKTLAQFEQGAGFYFTEAPAWNFKAMLTAHGTWAELRHDTLLYIKQAYAEKGGDGRIEPTFRIKPVPLPVHYIEPNIPFWQASISSVNKLYAIYDEYNLHDTVTSDILSNLISLYSTALTICQKEADNKPISQAENVWIASIAAELGKYVCLYSNPNASYLGNDDVFKMACIADVFTNTETGIVLETGVASPYRIYVALNDAHGGKRIAIGYCFSYVEFTRPIHERMTNEEWKSFAYKNDNTNFDVYYPFWARTHVLIDDKIF